MQKIALSPKAAISVLSVLLAAGLGAVAYLAYAGREKHDNADSTGTTAAQEYKGKNYAKAEELLEAQIQASPKDASTYNILGNVNRDQGDTDTAIANYKKAIEVDPKLLPAYINLANVYVNANKKADALSITTEGLKLFPGNRTLGELQAQAK